MEKYYQLTHPLKFDDAYEIMERINKDYPDQAELAKIGSGHAVIITKRYWENCQAYVSGNCKITPPITRDIEKAKRIKKIMERI